MTLRRSSGDSVAGAVTDSTGRFTFADVPAGAYRVAVRLRAGFRADAAADTSQSVAVTSGGTASVQLTARPVQEMVDSVRPGRTDTVTLASGVRLAVSVPTGTAPIPVRMRAGPTDAASWNGRTVLGPSAELLISGVAPPDSALVSFELPLSTNGPPPDGAAVRAFYLLPNGDSLSLSNLDAVIGTRQDPVSGQARSALLGVAPLSVAGSTTMRLAVTRSAVTCASVMALSPVAGFEGTEPLILLHGLQAEKTECADYVDFDPARETFRELLTVLRNEPEIRRRYTVYTFRYPTNDGIDNAASALATLLGPVVTAASAKATLVAHSMGGLVARRYLRTRGESEINQVITLATPHLGSTIADAGSSMVTFPGVSTCYQALDASAPSVRLLWWRLVSPFFLWPPGDSRGLRDLSAATPALGVTEPHRALMTLFFGRRPVPPVNHSLMANSVYAAGGCYHSVSGFTENDGVVAEISARPPWALHTRGPYPRDHTQMQGSNAASVNDTFLADLKALLLPSTISVSSNAPTAWTLNPGVFVGIGSGGTFAVRPQGAGTLYTLTPQPIAGRAVNVTNSRGGGSVVLLRPGENAAFTITYAGSGAPTAPSNLNAAAAPGQVNLTWSDNSSDEASFLVERALDSGGAFAALSTTGSGVAAYIDRAVTAGATYRYRVAAVNAFGQSAYSNEVTITLPNSPGAAGAAVSITAGALHTCAVSADGTARCWGNNQLGAIGQDFFAVPISRVPRVVRGGISFSTIAAGYNSTCALDLTGRAWCWGVNSRAAFGTPPAWSDMPVLVPQAPVLRSLAHGFSFACGIDVASAIHCWGSLSGTAMAPQPGRIASTETFDAVRGGWNVACAVDTTQRAMCWGDNVWGGFGSGTQYTRSSIPIAVAGPHRWLGVAPGTMHTCGVTTTGEAFCWGMQTRGQLGTGSTAPFTALVPAAVSGGLRFTQLASGDYHTCALTSAGAAYCWGDNTNGQLGIGAGGDRAVPTAVTGGVQFRAIAAGGAHTCGIDLAGGVWCWGANDQGQLGDGGASNAIAPRRVSLP